jgi:outer membrane protein assembly factor BamB
VFTATAEEIVALDAATGRQLWRLAARGVVAVPTAHAGWLIAGAGADLLALRAADGRLVWRQTLAAAPRAPVTIDGDRAYAPLVDGSIVALDIRDGTTVWRKTLPAACGAITAAGNRLFAPCTDNFFYSLDAADGDRRWRWRTSADVMSPAAQDVSRVYFASLDNIVRALDRGSGVQRWRHAMDARPLGGPVLDDDLLVVSGGSELRAVRAKDGTLAGRFTAPAELAAPAVFAPVDAASGARVVIVTGAPTGDWRVYGLMRLPEPTPAPLTEIPGRPLSPDGPPAPRGLLPPSASRLP